MLRHTPSPPAPKAEDATPGAAPRTGVASINWPEAIFSAARAIGPVCILLWVLWVMTP